MLDRKRVAFGAIFAAILLVVTLGGVELMASFFVPSWPARAMLGREPRTTPAALAVPFDRDRWLSEPENTWGMRDRERTLAKPPGTYRAVFVGDSFVESRFTPLSLPAAVQQRLDPSEKKIEAIDLGISATDPRSYYFRIRDVALEMTPDALLMFIYSGNDFMPPNEGYSSWPRFMDVSPGSSIVGSILPRTNWLLVNRLNLADLFKPGPQAAPPPNEEALIYDAVTASADQRVQRLAAHIKKYRYPALSEARIAEILSRGDSRFLDIALPHDGEQDYLMGWALDILMSWETGTWPVASSRQDATRLADNGHADATLSWIKASEHLARDRHVPLLLFLVPVGSVDPDYAAFWKPWPRAFSWNYVCEEWHAKLAAALAKNGIRFVDLRDDLAGVPGTYRKLDGHWSQKGLAIVADRVARELKNAPSQ